VDGAGRTVDIGDDIDEHDEDDVDTVDVPWPATIGPRCSPRTCC
jgi:hypothetical protein